MKLTRVDEDGARETLEATGDSVIVGRKPARGLKVEHPTVSREHARLFQRDGAWNVADLNSSNGTFVNGRKVSRSPLGPGDVLKLGSVELRIEGAAETAPAPPPPAAPSARPEPPPAKSPSAGDVEEIVLEDPPASGDSQHAPIPPASRRPRTDDPDRTMAMPRRPAPRPEPAATTRPPLSSAALRSERSGGVLGQDLSQQSFAKRALYVLIALAIAYGLFTVTSRLTETVVPEGELEGEGAGEEGVDPFAEDG